MPTKICSVCNEEKDEEAFYIRSDTGNRRSNCKSCCQKTNKKYVETHIEQVTAYKREWYVENLDRLLEKATAYRNENSEAVKLAIRLCYERNGHIYKVGHIQYITERRKTDPAFRLLGNLRHRVYSALKKSGVQKTDSTIELTGCTIKQLRIFLEAEFEPGMSWDNYGEWHIDHMKPCVKFNLEDPEEQKKCFHWTNLQPLWAIDNLKKGARYEDSD